MRSWWSLSAEQGSRSGQPEMMRRFVEASRRAEIVTLVNSAVSQEALGEAICAELCEAFEAETAFVVADRDGLQLIGSCGLQKTGVIRHPACLAALETGVGSQERGEDVLGLGARALLLEPVAPASGGRALLVVARMYDQPFDAAETALLTAVARSVGHALERFWLEADRDAAYLGTAEALAAALEAKDDYTADHARSIADLAVEVGRELGLQERALRDLRYGAVFHDIGKIAIPDAILNKPGPLSAEEYEVVKSHPLAGEQILAPVPFFAGVRPIVRHDHERWDGEGYPDGLRGAEIPIGARIVFVVDAWHAMTSDRPYRAAMSPEAAREELLAAAGSQFDPRVVDAFLTCLDRIAS